MSRADKRISSSNPAVLTVFDGARDMDVERAATVEVKSFEELRDYLKRDPVVVANKTDAPLIARGRCAGQRKKASIRLPWPVVLDLDKVVLPPDQAHEILQMLGYDHLIHTTFSDGAVEGKRSYRTYVNYMASCASELEAVTRHVFDVVGVEPTHESWNSPWFFGPSVHPDRPKKVEYYYEVSGDPFPWTWSPTASDLGPVASAGLIDGNTGVINDVDMDEVRDALRYVTDDDGNRARWMQVGMALHCTGHSDARAIWDEWSERQESGKYDAEDQDRVWESFSIDGNESGQVTIGTIHFLAKEAGWRGLRHRSAAEDFAGIGDGAACDRENVLRRLNKRYAYLATGQGRVVDLDATDGSLVFLSTKAFTEKENFPRWHVGRRIVTAGNEWLHHWDGRRTYDRIDFLPPGAATEIPASTLNLWRGWRYENAAHVGRCDLFLDHIQRIICSQDAEVFQWVMAWLAHLVQKPSVKPGTAIVLRSIEGTGKGIFANAIRELCGVHGIQVAHPRQLTGHFNSHLANKLLICADEVTWGGYKKDDGVLKTIVTEPTQVIEHKGQDSMEVRSFCRVLISSNNEWVVPAGRSSRRFLVLDVSNARVRDQAYFKAILNQMQNGGYAALWHHLRGLDLGQLPNPTVIIPTKALRDQKLESLDDRGKWLLEVLRRGEVGPRAAEDTSWPSFVSSSDLHDCYLEFAHELRVARPSTPQQLSMLLKEVFGSECFERRSVEGRQVRGVVLPPLNEARKRFEAWLQSEVDWEE